MRIRVVGQAEASGDEDEGPHIYGKSKSKKFIIVEHGEVQLQWNFPPRTWNSEADTNAEAFDQLNLYFGLLDKQTQAGIFAEYENVHRLLKSTNIAHVHCEDLIEAIRPCMKALFDYIDPGKFYNWVWTSLKPSIPLSASAIRFDPNTMPGTRERTYLLEDYKGLIPLSIVIRAACPVWFDFAAITKGQLSREHKDIYSYSLIEKSWPADSGAMQRLEEFVDHTVGADRNNPANILAGIATDDVVYWALSSLVINRLPIVDVMGYNTATPVVSALYNFVRHRVSTIGSSQPAIKNKFAETSYASDENNQSYLEGFRNRIALTIGQESYGDYYLERQANIVNALNTVNSTGRKTKLSEFHNLEVEYALLNRVAPGIDMALVKDALQSSKVLHNLIITDQQITIAAWLFHPYSQVRTVGNLFKQRITTMLGLAQAVLLHYGKNELAMLVTAGYESTGNQATTYTFGESIAQLRAAEQVLFRETFPFEQRSRKKPKNFVFDDVYQLVSSLQDYDINCTFSEETLRRVQKNNPNRKYFLRKDTVMMFMNYAKWLAERPIVRIDPMEVYQRLVREQMGIKTETF